MFILLINYPVAHTKGTVTHASRQKDQSNPQNPELRWAWIKYQLNLSDLSLRKLALSKGVKPQTISKCRHIPYPKMEKVLADAVGLKPQELFPDRYYSNGLPNRSISNMTAC